MKTLAAVSFSLLLAGCGSLYTTSSSSGSNTLIPNGAVTLAPSTTISLEQLVYWGGVGAVAYLVLDPFSPNWEIEEARFPNNRYHLSLKMKRYANGGSGEARVVFNRRAKELVNAGGFAGFRVLEYSEGLESSVIGSQRVSEGVIALLGPDEVAAQQR